ncbi:MAG: hypothetical protein ACO3YN_17635 [Rubrivivax sp.]
MDFTIEYYSEAVQDEILNLPDSLAARFIALTRRKKTQKTPPREIELARNRMKEVKHANP